MSPFLLLESWGLLLLGPVGRALGIPGAFLLHNTGCGIYGRGVGHGERKEALGDASGVGATYPPGRRDGNWWENCVHISVGFWPWVMTVT
jgi:hypothetical protein